MTTGSPPHTCNSRTVRGYTMSANADGSDMSDRHIQIKVHPPTVPTTGSDFHESTTHVDALGMPVAFYTDEHAGGKQWPYHPTPCCGASAKGCDGYIGCRACYHEIDPAFGNVPVEPFRPVA